MHRNRKTAWLYRGCQVFFIVFACIFLSGISAKANTIFCGVYAASVAGTNADGDPFKNYSNKDGIFFAGQTIYAELSNRDNSSAIGSYTLYIDGVYETSNTSGSRSSVSHRHIYYEQGEHTFRWTGTWAGSNQTFDISSHIYIAKVDLSYPSNVQHDSLVWLSATVNGYKSDDSSYQRQWYYSEGSGGTKVLIEGAVAEKYPLRADARFSNRYYYCRVTNGGCSIFSDGIKLSIAYQISYDANGGWGAPSPQNKYYNTDIKLSAATPSRTGYQFLGWSTSQTATSASYSSGSTFSSNQSVTLYAVWRANTYVISYNANGGSGAPVNQIKTHGVDLKLSSTVPYWAGHSFLGWATSSTAAKPEYTSGATFTKNEATPLYAVWSANTVYIDFDANGGSGAPSRLEKVYGVSIKLPYTTPKWTGHTFLGWSTSKTATRATYLPGDTYTGNSPVTLYAVWEVQKYRVTYVLNGGSGSLSSQEKIHGTDLRLSSESPTRTGYLFLGWGTSAYAAAAAYQPGDWYRDDRDITLYAIWKTKEYTVSYDGNGGSTAPNSQVKLHGTDLKLSSGEGLTRKTYTLLGWAASKYATAATYPLGGVYRGNQDIILYAVWAKGADYIVSYDTNGGGVGPASQVKEQDVDLTLTDIIPEREGYKFKGWAVSRTGAVKYQPKAVYRENEGITLYAVWEALKEYTVTYDANGGSGAPARQVKYEGVNLKLSDIRPEKADSSFLGWSVSKTATVPGYYPSGIYSGNANLSLYAVWELKRYTITYDANGGSGAPGRQIKYHGQDLTLSSVEPKKAGVLFLGWSKNPASSSAEYLAGAKYPENGEQTLYAVWGAPREYTVAYDANGGSGAPDAQIKYQKTDLKLSSVKPDKDQSLFLGWSKSKGGTEVVYQPGAVYKEDADITLYAVWGASGLTDYAVTYDANGGSGAPEKQTKYQNVGLVLSTVRPSREGFIFMGWATEKNAAKASYLPGEIYDENKPLTLYAVWGDGKKQYSITYDANGGSGAPEKQVKDQGVDLVLSVVKPTRTQYRFAGWATSKLSETANYQPGDIYAINASVTLYAVWEAEGKTYTITYDANGGTGAPGRQSKTQGQKLTLSEGMPAKEGYTFLGWAVTKSAAVPDYQPGDIYEKDADITLYAVWEEGSDGIEKYTVRYDANGGSGAPGEQIKYQGTDLILSLTEPVKEKSIFLGWAASKYAKQALYQPGELYGQDEEITLYAVWEEGEDDSDEDDRKTLEYVVMYDANGGSGAPSPQLKKAGERLILSSLRPVRDGYSFLGWALSADSNQVAYDAGGVYQRDEEITLYAVWEKEIHTDSDTIQDILSGAQKNSAKITAKASDVTTDFAKIEVTGAQGAAYYLVTLNDIVYVNSRQSMVRLAGLEYDTTYRFGIYAIWGSADGFRIDSYSQTSVTVRTLQKTTEKLRPEFSAPEEVAKVYGAKNFRLSVSTNGGGDLSFASSDKKVATVSSTGKVKIKGCGAAIITVVSAETAEYLEGSTEIIITVRPAKVKGFKISSPKKGYIRCQWSKDKSGAKYKMQFSKNKSFKNPVPVDIMRNSTKKYEKYLGRGFRCYVRMRAFVVKNGETYYSKWTKKKSLKLK